MTLRYAVTLAAAVCVAAAVALSGCDSGVPPAGAPPTRLIPTPVSVASAPQSPTAGTSTPVTLFRIVNGVELPNPELTPGQVNRGTTSAQVCGRGLPAARHPSYGTRKAVLVSYGLTTEKSHDYIVERLIPTSLGGTTNQKNLWPVRRTGTANVTQKQALDARLLAQVCSGQLTLANAQRLLRRSWWDAYHSVH